MGSAMPGSAPSESPLLTYRFTWHVDAECVDHLVMAHDFTEARSISVDLMLRALGRRPEWERLEFLAER